MAARGPYAKGVAKKREILDVALEIVDRHGYSNATVTELADAVGLSPNGLLHHFGSKAALFTDILRHTDEAGLAAMERGELNPSGLDFPTLMVEMMRTQQRIPGYAELHLRLTAEAMRPEHPSHDYLAGRFRTERDLVTPTFERLQREGRVRAMPGNPTVTLVGPPSELMLYAHGRLAVARVRAIGDEAALAQIADTDLSV